MKIFISWSGERSEALAKALREWFPLVLHFVEPWLSQSDIQAGERWSVEIAKELENCNFGVICITRENLSSPWILFEAGALAKSMQDGRVIPLLLDLDFKEISGPLAQFQAKKSDSGGIRELVASLNKAAPSPVPDAQLERLFSALWSDLENNILSIPKGSAPAKHNRPQGEILEELVSSVRTVEMRVRDVMDDEPFARKRRRMRFHPSLMHEMMHRIAKGPRDPIQLLFIAGMIRDDAPWIYELALEAYRAVVDGRKEQAQKSIQRFRDALELLSRGPFAEAYGFDPMYMKIFRTDFIEILDFMEVEDFEIQRNLNPNQVRIRRRPLTKKEG